MQGLLKNKRLFPKLKSILASRLRLKNWPPSMKVKKMETFHIKCGLMGCTWSCLNTPGTGNTQYHPILKLGEFPIPNIISPLG